MPGVDGMTVCPAGRMNAGERETIVPEMTFMTASVSGSTVLRTQSTQDVCCSDVWLTVDHCGRQ
jgi:hypothetical protein